MNQTRRRRLLLAAGGLLVAPLIANGQQARQRVFRVFGLNNSTPEATSAYMEALEDGFRELGYVPGSNLIIKHLSSGGRPERLPGLAAEIVQSGADVIVAASNAETAAAMKATTSIPIVMALGYGPVEAGLVSSLARPGGNVTGITTDASLAIIAKWLEFLTEIKPNLRRVGLLWDPTVPGFTQFMSVLTDAASRLGLTLRSIEVRRGDEMDGALAQIAREGVDALCVVSNVLTFTYRNQIAAFTAKQRLPAITYMREFVEAGILMSYGADLLQLYRHSSVFVDRILKGAKPADLPVEQPTKFELVLNLKTARALSLTIPQSVLLRANKVID